MFYLGSQFDVHELEPQGAENQSDIRNYIRYHIAPYVDAESLAEALNAFCSRAKALPLRSPHAARTRWRQLQSDRVNKLCFPLGFTKSSERERSTVTERITIAEIDSWPTGAYFCCFFILAIRLFGLYLFYYCRSTLY